MMVNDIASFTEVRQPNKLSTCKHNARTDATNLHFDLEIEDQ